MGRVREIKIASIESLESPFFTIQMKIFFQSQVLGQHQKLVQRLHRVEQVQVKDHYDHVFKYLGLKFCTDPLR